MEAFTYENIFYDDYSLRHSFYLPKPVSKEIKTREYVFRVMSASGLILCLVYIFFIKEISPLQKATTDEKNGLEDSHLKILGTAKRGSQTIWKNVLLRSSCVNNSTDRSFKTQIACLAFPSLTHLNMRKKFALECDDCKGTITTGNSSDVFTIPFNDVYLRKCLGNVIDHCCMRHGTVVPNIVHYAWYSYKQLQFFSFLSCMSVLRFTKPCLILFHGSFLPSGNCWDYFISIAPNVIHIRRDSPTSLFDHKLKFEDLLSDAMRIEVIIAHGGIYLDCDGIILRPLTTLMKYKYTKVHELINVNMNAEFLRHWYKSYKNNYRDEWDSTI